MCVLYILLLVFPSSQLMHGIVFAVPKSIAFVALYAEMRPVEITRQVVILNSGDDDFADIILKHVINGCLIKRILAPYVDTIAICTWVLRNIRGHDGFTTSNNEIVLEMIEPLICLFQRSRAVEYDRTMFYPDGGRFPEISDVNAESQRLMDGWHKKIERIVPNVRSSILNKILSRISVSRFGSRSTSISGIDCVLRLM